MSPGLARSGWVLEGERETLDAVIDREHRALLAALAVDRKGFIDGRLGGEPVQDRAPDRVDVEAGQEVVVVEFRQNNYE